MRTAGPQLAPIALDPAFGGRRWLHSSSFELCLRHVAKALVDKLRFSAKKGVNVAGHGNRFVLLINYNLLTMFIALPH